MRTFQEDRAELRKAGKIDCKVQVDEETKAKKPFGLSKRQTLPL